MIADPIKLKNINNELDELKPFLDVVGYESNVTVNSLVKELQAINEKLWVIEDKLRDKEKSKEFDNEFIQLARGVYFTNDERARIKKNLNEVTNSKFVEEKSYQKYS
jgi:ribosomal protein L15E